MPKLMTIPNWDWNRKLPSDIWHKLGFDRYPNWEVVGEEHGYPYPASVHLTIIKGRDRSSKEIAIEADDWLDGHFYYRDWTKDGIPFVDDGEEYNSRFWFQTVADAKKFWELYKGEPNIDSISSDIIEKWLTGGRYDG